ESSKNKKKGFVRSIKFDDLFNELGIDGCDVMKVDIEGAEYECLLSASLETLRKIQYIAIEFDGGHDEFGQLVTKLAEVFNLHILGMPSKGGYIYGKRY